MNVPVRYRPMTPTDRNRVLTDWLRGSFGYTWQTTPRSHYEGHKRVIFDVLRRGHVTVACSPDDVNQILAWACYELTPLPVLHYVYTGQIYRRYRIASELLKMVLPNFGETPLVCTHTGRLFGELAKKHHLEFDPYALFPSLGETG